MTNAAVAATAAENAATWTKLRDGSWGLRITGPLAVTAGMVVTAKRSNGTTSREAVGEVVWSDGKVTLARVGAKPREASAGGYSYAPRAAAAPRPGARMRKCGYCDGLYPADGLCPRCGDEG